MQSPSNKALHRRRKKSGKKGLLLHDKLYDVKELISKEESLHVKVHLFVTLKIIFLSFLWRSKDIFRSFDIHFAKGTYFFLSFIAASL